MPENLDPSVVQAVANTNFKVLAELPTQIAALNFQILNQFTQQMQQIAVANTTVGLDHIYTLSISQANAEKMSATGNSVAEMVAALRATSQQPPIYPQQ